MKVSLIISTYNWPEALRLSLMTVLHQTQYPHEIVIADDGSTIETQNMIKELQTEYPIPIQHIWHEDKGFRKTMIMNKAVKAATGDYIIQIDGDILHPFTCVTSSDTPLNIFARKGILNALNLLLLLIKLLFWGRSALRCRKNLVLNALMSVRPPLMKYPGSAISR